MIYTKEMYAAEPVNQKDLWGTPLSIFLPLHQLFNFTLDPCCTVNTAKCDKFYTPAENGLVMPWNDNSVFVNPPYSRGNIDKWVARCADQANENTKVVALLPVSTSSDWFQNYVLGHTIYWVDKRIRFVGAKDTAPFSSMIVHFNGVDKNLTWKQ